VLVPRGWSGRGPMDCTPRGDFSRLPSLFGGEAVSDFAGVPARPAGGWEAPPPGWSVSANNAEAAYLGERNCTADLGLVKNFVFGSLATGRARASCRTSGQGGQHPAELPPHWGPSSRTGLGGAEIQGSDLGLAFGEGSGPQDASVEERGRFFREEYRRPRRPHALSFRHKGCRSPPIRRAKSLGHCWLPRGIGYRGRRGHDAGCCGDGLHLVQRA